MKTSQTIPEKKLAKNSTSLAPSCDETLYATCEAVGDLIQFWGFKKLTGMVWCYLYLSPEPCSALEIREGLGISAGSVSMTLKELLHWGVVSRSTPHGERTQQFTAEGDLWKMVSKVLRERDLEQIERTLDTLRNSREALFPADRSKKESLEKFRAARLTEMIQAGNLVSGLLSKLLKTGRINVRPFWPFHLGSLVGSGARKKQSQKKGTRS